MLTALVADEQLKSPTAAAVAKFEHQTGYGQWKPLLADHIRKVQEARQGAGGESRGVHVPGVPTHVVGKRSGIGDGHGPQ
jgi:hypothetical protein